MTDRRAPRNAPDRPISRRRAAERAEARLRLRAVVVVALVLAGTLVAGSTVHRRVPALPVALPTGELPAVSLTSSASVEWQCPGPLPAGSSVFRSSVIVANPGSRTADVEVGVDGVAGKARGGSALPSWTERLSVAPHSQRTLGLHTTGPPQDDAVSVLATAGSVAVFESVAMAPSAGHRGRPRGAGSAVPEAPHQSPCATGTTSNSYIAAGSTSGRSDVVVSLFNPTATQAVAAVQVSTGSGEVSPPALQGLIIKAYSLQVVDLGTSVVQQSTIAVSETASTGRLVLGAWETLEADTTATTSVTGQALLLGVATAQSSWVMSPGSGQPDRSVRRRVFDPGSRPSTVTISVPVAGYPLSEISAVVPPGGVREILLPLPAPVSSGSSKRKAPPAVEGPIVVRTAEGVGIVIARVAVARVSAHADTVGVMAATANPASAWLVPAVTETPLPPGSTALAGGLVISNPGTSAVRVAVSQMSTSGAVLSPLTQVTVAAGSTRFVVVRITSTGGSFAGYELSAVSEVEVEQGFYAVGTPSAPIPFSPAPVAGIPVLP